MSTGEQTTDNQLAVLDDVAQRTGWKIVATYRDDGISGSKGPADRPGLRALLKDAARRKFDLVAVWSVDRLGRSLQDLLAFLGELHALGVDLYLHTSGIDTTTPGGKALYQMMGVIAEFEREMIRERVRAGLARARAAGRIGGRPRVGGDVEDAIRAELARGTGVRRTAHLVGCGVSTVQRVARCLRHSQKSERSRPPSE